MNTVTGTRSELLQKLCWLTPPQIMNYKNYKLIFYCGLVICARPASIFVIFVCVCSGSEY